MTLGLLVSNDTFFAHAKGAVARFAEEHGFAGATVVNKYMLATSNQAERHKRERLKASP